MRAMSRRLPSAFVALLALSGALAGRPAVADDPNYADTFLRAERAERALGDLNEALRLYTEATALAGDDVARRAGAEVRAGACLRRLGRADDARRLLTAWATPREGVPEGVASMAAAELSRLDAKAGADATATAGSAAAADTEHQIGTLRDENARLQAKLSAALLDAERVDEQEVERLVEELKKKDRQLAELREQLDARSPLTAKEALEVRREEKRGRSRVFTQAARAAHREGRFADARVFLNDALVQDPDNADARALLARISAPLGDRERLYQEILEAVALAHQVRRGRLAAEVRSLLDEGRRRLDEAPDDAQSAVDPLERALALIDVAVDAVADADAVRKEATGLLRRAESRGARRAPVGPPELESVEQEWIDGLRKLLEHAGREVDGTLLLRFHDLERALSFASTGLPPVGPRPVGWTLSAERVSAADLLTAYLAEDLASGFATANASIETVGQTAVALADAATQQRIEDRVAGLAISPGPALRLTVSARRGVPGAWEAALARLGVVTRAVEGGARAAVLPPVAARAFFQDLDGGGHPTLARAELTAAALRAFRLTAGTAAASLSLRVLPVGGDRPGAAMSVDVLWTPDGRRDGAHLAQHAEAGGALDPSGALVLFGLADPDDPSRDLAVIVHREGESPTGTAPGAAPPSTGADAAPDAVDPAGAGEYLLPASLRSIDEVGAAALTLPEHPLPSRTDALRHRFSAFGSTATVLEVRDDRVVVVAPQATHAAIRGILARAEAAPLQSFDVDLFELDEAAERRLIETVKTFSSSDGGFIWAQLKDAADTRNVAALLAATGTPLQLPEQRVTVPPLVRRDVGGVARFTYLRELDVRDESPAPSIARFETSFVEEGFLLSLRPFGRTTGGLVDLDLSVRATFVRDRGATFRETPLGKVYTLRPATSDLWGDLSVMVRPEGAVVLAGMVNPFRSARGKARLAALVRPVP